VLVVVGLLVVEGTAGTIILACGFLALLGAGIRLISRNDPAPQEEPRVPAGHSGVWLLLPPAGSSLGDPDRSVAMRELR
jgi:hypothetical protein